MNFLSEKCKQTSKMLLVSEYVRVRSDSLGPKETRFVVLEGKIINSSRQVHSVKHKIPQSHYRKAINIIGELGKIGGFPQNYVLDIGEFISDESFTDIVEINPISCAMCYINNSIFVQSSPAVQPVRDRLGFGYEYCLDYLKYPALYFSNRASNSNYCYESDEHYCFL